MCRLQICKAILIILWLQGLLGCRTTSGSSTAKIDNGIIIFQNSRNKAEPVVELRLNGVNGFICTGTIVSTNTILTAHHCVSHRVVNTPELFRKVNVEACIISGAYADKCSKVAFLNTKFGGAYGHGQAERDTAAYFFDNDPFRHFFEVDLDYFFDPQQPQTGEVIFAGFADLKRWGKAQLIERYPSETGTVLYSKRSNKSVNISEGDSGGPLIRFCQLVGVASGNTVDQRGNRYATSTHSELSHDVNFDFLTKINIDKVHICGMRGTNAKYCPMEGKFVEADAAQLSDKDFPCVPADDAYAKPRSDTSHKNLPQLATTNASGITPSISRKQPKIGINGEQRRGKLLINEIYDNLAAKQLGWRAGWFIIAVNGASISTLDELRNILKTSAEKEETKEVKFLIQPGPVASQQLEFIIPFGP